jgi:voltage-gated potassium channel
LRVEGVGALFLLRLCYNQGYLVTITPIAATDYRIACEARMLVRDREARANLYERYCKVTDLPLLVLAVLMIPSLLGPVVFHVTPEQENMLEAVDWFIYALFAVDFFIRLYLAPYRGPFLRENWLDIIILALPLLRPLRLVRSARLLRLIRLAWLLAFVGVAVAKLRIILTSRGLYWVILVTMGVVVVSALLVASFESGAGGSITDIPTALWWAAATVTTVGYGDTYPVTAEGRGIAVFLMVAGIIFFGILTANIAAYFVESKESSVYEHMENKLDEVLRRLDSIEASQAERTEPERVLK